MKLVSCSGVMAPLYTMLPPSSRLSAMLVVCAVVPATRYSPQAADWRMPTAYSLLQGRNTDRHAQALQLEQPLPLHKTVCLRSYDLSCMPYAATPEFYVAA